MISTQVDALIRQSPIKSALVVVVSKANQIIATSNCGGKIRRRGNTLVPNDRPSKITGKILQQFLQRFNLEDGSIRLPCPGFLQSARFRHSIPPEIVLFAQVTQVQPRSLPIHQSLKRHNEMRRIV